MIRVTVFHRQDRHHCSQIFAGLAHLRRLGVIELVQKPWRQSRLADLLDEQPLVILAEIDGRTVCFDMRDMSGVDQRFLEEVEVYFKRSYVPGSGSDPKVQALGFNFDVWNDGPDWSAVGRLLQGTGSLASLPRRLGLNLGSQPRVGFFGNEPDFAAPPTVLFLTRLWGASRGYDSEASRLERAAINETRIGCVRMLKSELGDEFIGGIEKGDLAARLAPDLVCPPRVSDKGAYLKLVKETPICITTTGLHGSNGWKLGEYVALARAIVCEPLLHDVPGEFAAGKNYLEFSSSEQCVQQVVRLREDRQLREAMMARNLDYYRHYLRPDVLVLNALKRVNG